MNKKEKWWLSPEEKKKDDFWESVTKNSITWIIFLILGFPWFGLGFTVIGASIYLVFPVFKSIGLDGPDIISFIAFLAIITPFLAILLSIFLRSFIPEEPDVD